MEQPTTCYPNPNMSFFSVPNYASAYNIPARGKPYTPPCAAYPENSGWIYHTDAGKFGNCSAGITGNKTLPRWDFICPKGRPCYSATSPAVGMTPDEICCGVSGFSAHPANNILGPLGPVTNWMPGVWQ